MPVTNAQIDAAVPVDDEPDRALTNAALKDLVVDVAAAAVLQPGYIVLDLPATAQNRYAALPFNGQIDRVRAMALPDTETFELTIAIGAGAAIGNIDGVVINSATPTTITPSTNASGSGGDLVAVTIAAPSGSLTKAWVEIRVAPS